MQYNKYGNPYPVNNNSIEGLLLKGELLLWRGKPKKNAFILNKSIVMLPIALLWFAIDGFIISTMLSTGAMNGMLFFIVPFFALHLMPVWIWLWNVLSANRSWKNTEYAVTDKRIIIRGGVVGYNFQNIYYTEISSVDLRVGVIDRMLGVGDIVIYTGIMPVNVKSTRSPMILDIENPYEVFNRIQKIVLDIQSDIRYPNDMRPRENRGYNTTYRP